MSVQLSTNSVGQRTPTFRQSIDLLGLFREFLGNALKQRDFIGHDLKVSNGPLPGPDHFCVSVQGLAAEDNALIGFGGGHARIIDHG